MNCSFPLISLPTSSTAASSIMLRAACALPSARPASNANTAPTPSSRPWRFRPQQEQSFGSPGQLVQFERAAMIRDVFFGTGMLRFDFKLLEAGSGLTPVTGPTTLALEVDGHPLKGLPRHPIVEDDVVIYAGATVLGRVTLGRGASIGGNVWLTHDVPPGGHVTQAVSRHAAQDATPAP